MAEEADTLSEQRKAVALARVRLHEQQMELALQASKGQLGRGGWWDAWVGHGCLEARYKQGSEAECCVDELVGVTCFGVRIWTFLFLPPRFYCRGLVLLCNVLAEYLAEPRRRGCYYHWTASAFYTRATKVDHER